MTPSSAADLVTQTSRARLGTTASSSARDFWVLTKPEVNFLILIATFTEFYLGCPTNLDGFPLAQRRDSDLGIDQVT
jgi:heme O synthase-like polyprenyltransferase